MDHDDFLTPDLARAGRALTKVSVGTIARYADLTKTQVRDYERGIAGLPADAIARLRSSLEHYGALFVAEDETAGYGVRRVHPRVGFMRLNTWEGEGGPPAQ